MSPSPNNSGRGTGRWRPDFWSVASILSALVLLGGAGWLVWPREGMSGPAVGETVEMPSALGRGNARLGEGLRNLVRPAQATQPTERRTARPSTTPARN